MPQGGFSRDFQRAAVLRTEAEKRKEEKQRDRIGQEVIYKISDTLNNKVEEIERGLILKQNEIVAEFIQITRDRNQLLKFLLWSNFVSLLGLAFVLGYFL